MEKKPKSPALIPLSEALNLWQGNRTQKQASSDLGVNLRTYQNWVQGRAEPRGLAYKIVSSTVYEEPEKN